MARRVSDPCRRRDAWQGVMRWVIRRYQFGGLIVLPTSMRICGNDVFRRRWRGSGGMRRWRVRGWRTSSNFYTRLSSGEEKALRSEEHTSELQSPYVISYAVF